MIVTSACSCGLATHLFIPQEVLEIIIRREPHTGLDSIPNHDSANTGIQSRDTSMRQRLLQRPIRAQRLSS